MPINEIVIFLPAIDPMRKFWNEANYKNKEVNKNKLFSNLKFIFLK